MKLKRCDNSKGWDGATSFNVSPKCENNKGNNEIEIPALGDTVMLCDSCVQALLRDATQCGYKVKIVRRYPEHG